MLVGTLWGSAQVWETDVRARVWRWGSLAGEDINEISWQRYVPIPHFSNSSFLGGVEKTRRITVKTHTPLTQPCPYQIHSGSDGQPDLRTGAAEGLQTSTVFRSTRFLGQQDSKSPSGTSGTNPLKMNISESLRDGPHTEPLCSWYLGWDNIA